MFITFEGGEGSGKSTQIERVQNYLKNRGYDVCVTREPGGVPMCERVRDILFDYAWSALSEALLFSASRYELSTRVIQPALTRGGVVLCDRFIDSTRVYQGYVRGVPMDMIDTIIKHAVPVMPDLTLIFDMDPTRARSRLAGRDDINHMDDRPLSFHERVRSGFLDLAKKDPKRCVVIQADQHPDAVFHDICQALSRTPL